MDISSIPGYIGLITLIGLTVSKLLTSWREKKKVLNRVQFITALTSCICWILYALLEGQQIVIILTGGLLIPIAIGFYSIKVPNTTKNPTSVQGENEFL